MISRQDLSTPWFWWLDCTIIQLCLKALAIEARVILRQLWNHQREYHRNLLDRIGQRFVAISRKKFGSKGFNWRFKDSSRGNLHPSAILFGVQLHQNPNSNLCDRCHRHVHPSTEMEKGFVSEFVLSKKHHMPNSPQIPFVQCRLMPMNPLLLKYAQHHLTFHFDSKSQVLY